MSEITVQDNALTKEDVRDYILYVEEEASKLEGVQFGNVLPLVHNFAQGLYTREIFIPAYNTVIGKIHKDSHAVFFLQGEMDVITEEGGLQHLIAPCYFIAPAGVKRLAKTTADCRWVTVHANPSNSQDQEFLEDFIISKSYEEFEAYKNQLEETNNKLLNKTI